MKKILFLFCLCFSAASIVRANPIAVVEGKPVFFVYASQAEKDFALSTGAIDMTAQPFEVNLSTCLVIVIDGKVELGFENYSDWMSCQTKAGLKRKVRKIRALIDSMSDLPAIDSKDLKERAGWVKAYYLALP